MAKSKAVKGAGKLKAKRTVNTKVVQAVKSVRYPGRNQLLMKRINFAFKKLRAMGIVAKRNFTCCCSCGHRAMQDEGHANYVFYHDQAKTSSTTAQVTLICSIA